MLTGESVIHVKHTYKTQGRRKAVRVLVPCCECWWSCRWGLVFLHVPHHRCPPEKLAGPIVPAGCECAEIAVQTHSWPQRGLVLRGGCGDGVCRGSWPRGRARRKPGAGGGWAVGPRTKAAELRDNFALCPGPGWSGEKPAGGGWLG